MDMYNRFVAGVFCSILAMTTTTGLAAIKTQSIDYQQGGVTFQGYLAYDDSIQGKRPGILICHEWWGLNDYPKHRAEQLAALGYVAFALDVYGKGVIATNPTDAARLSGEIGGNRDLIRQRATAGLDVLRAQPQCDASKIAVIGYCFGGMVALELARAGTDLSAVISFHGNLSTPNPAAAIGCRFRSRDAKSRGGLPSHFLWRRSPRIHQSRCRQGWNEERRV
jgi:dienelactone hydrolase